MTLSATLFPPVGYMAIWLFHPGVVLEAHENYQKQSYRSRYHIAGPNGLQVLNVPVDKKGLQHCPIKEVEIVYTEPWPLLHLRSLETAYNKSPYYLYYADAIADLLKTRHRSLWDLCIASVTLTGSLAGISHSVVPTESYIPATPFPFDLRQTIHPKKPLPWEGKAQLPEYHQVFSEKYPFIPGLSILDLLFNEGPQSLSWLQTYYQRIFPHISE